MARYILFVGLTIAYTKLSSLYSVGGGSRSLLSELPLWLYLFWLFDQFQRRPWWSLVNALILTIASYVAWDWHYYTYRKIPRFSDFNALPVLIDILPPGIVVTAALLLFGVLLSIALNLDRRRLDRNLACAIPLFLLAALVLKAPAYVVTAMQAYTPPHDRFERTNDSRRYGRLYTMVLEAARKEESRIRLSQGVVDYDTLLRRRTGDPSMYAGLPNIHLLVMESFLDPRRFRQLRFSGPPMDPEFISRYDRAATTSISPVTAGGTPDAEFEVLCGLPPMRMLHSLEFLAFSGKRTVCLPAMLDSMGYVTVASHPYKPHTFNRARAYPGLGFERSLFADRYSPGAGESIELDDVDDQWLFDGSLFRQNLELVETLLDEDEPFLNYVLSAGGHYPFHLNEAARPAVVDSNADSEVMHGLVNHSFYRSRALIRYLDRLTALDPGAMIFVVNDHLPPMRGTDLFRRFGYQGLHTGDAALSRFENVFLAIDSGQWLQLGLSRHKDIFYRILDILTKGGYCKARDCRMKDYRPLKHPEVYREDYMAVMNLATR